MIATTRHDYTVHECPPKLTGKELEALVLRRGDYLKKDHVATLKRNGVKSSTMGDGKVVIKKSFPDITGTIAPHGRRIEIECKVSGESSFKLTESGDKLHSHQLEYLLEKASFGALSYLLIHFNLRVGKRVTHGEFTVAIAVHPDLELWRAVENGEIKSINRSVAKEIGIVVPWGYHTSRVRTLTPDIRVLFEKWS